MKARSQFGLFSRSAVRALLEVITPDDGTQTRALVADCLRGGEPESSYVWTGRVRGLRSARVADEGGLWRHLLDCLCPTPWPPHAGRPDPRCLLARST